MFICVQDKNYYAVHLAAYGKPVHIKKGMDLIYCLLGAIIEPGVSHRLVVPMPEGAGPFVLQVPNYQTIPGKVPPAFVSPFPALIIFCPAPHEGGESPQVPFSIISGKIRREHGRGI